MAESKVAAQYIAAGAILKGQRIRNCAGELDLILLQEACVIFVEVKARATLVAALEAISLKQWKRLESAAEVFMIEHMELVSFNRRFDVAAVDRYGRIQIEKNARSFDL